MVVKFKNRTGIKVQTDFEIYPKPGEWHMQRNICKSGSGICGDDVKEMSKWGRIKGDMSTAGNSTDDNVDRAWSKTRPTLCWLRDWAGMTTAC